MKIAFATCVQLGYSCIQEIYKIGGKLDLLVTLKDEKNRDKSGRIYLDDFAKTHKIPLLKIDNINDPEVLQSLKENRIDWFFIIGWSQIAREALLNTPVKGCIGMHPTLLPEGRGRASIPWAILKRLDKTGVSMFRMDTGVDTGDLLGQEIIPLKKDETATELYEKVNEAHVRLISKCWKAIEVNTLTGKPQDNALATKWPGRKPEDGEITKEMFLSEAECLVRAVTHPYPGAFYQDGDQTILIWKAKTALEEPDGYSIRFKDGYLIPIEYEVREKAPC